MIGADQALRARVRRLCELQPAPADLKERCYVQAQLAKRVVAVEDLDPLDALTLVAWEFQAVFPHPQ